ncbi:MAG TPA: MBL fold metallo-hydrolase [Blastocatellia bacterium]|nr:MBL fold metallo-hydrolase [Blastocatellia bacterium]
MQRFLAAVLLVSLTALSLAQSPARKTLEIYYVDVEGGAATLIVTPAGESILVDAGWPGFEGRDAKRIQAALQQAGITQIDHLIVTHYHVDHFGGVPQLAKLVPIKNHYNHGELPNPPENASQTKQYADYIAAANSKTVTVKPGDEIKLRTAKGTPPVTLRFLAARGETISGKTKEANPVCADAKPMPEDKSDNARSIVFKLSYGTFDFFDAGDLTWNIEHKLVCPSNVIGKIDLYQVTHHGMDISNNPVLLKSISPTVAIMNNGPKKGGSANTVKWLRELPSLQALYQVHRNVATSDADNTTPEFIANLDADGSDMIWVSVDATRKMFTVTNGRTKASKSFAIK